IHPMRPSDCVKRKRANALACFSTPTYRPKFATNREGGISRPCYCISVMDRVLEELVRRADAGETVALCTVVSARGSTPQAAGARMLLLADGQTIGTLGGGCVEAAGRSQAIRILQSRSSKLLTFKLDHDYGWDDGLICGGSMDIYVQTLADREGA